MTASQATTNRQGSGPGKTFSLRLRISIAAGLILAFALSLVGLALATANERSAVVALQDRMQSWAYLVLAAAEFDSAGKLSMNDELGDPRLSQPGSGVLVQINSLGQIWKSSSALGINVPQLDSQAAGQNVFMAPANERQSYVYQMGLIWQSEDEQQWPLTVSVVVDAAEVDRQTNAFRFGLWGALGAAGIILLLAQILLIWLTFRPLQQVAVDVATIESGESDSLQGSYPSELEPLARNLNRLLATEKANQQRYRNALDSLAHSLKTPLAVIRSGLDALDEESIDAMRRATDDMHHLVATRLQRAAGSARRTMVQPVQVEEAVSRLLRSLEKVYSHKMIKTSVKIPPGLQFYGESRDLLEIMGNLLDNAFKYGQRQVDLEAGALVNQSGQAGFWMRIEDDGPGIAKDQWPVLLQRGVRGDERVEGHGLGLAIVLELLNAYGGTIEIARSKLGGARINIAVPGSFG